MIVRISDSEKKNFEEEKPVPGYNDIAKNPELIEFFDNPDDETAQLAAISNDPDALLFIKNPTDKVRMKAIEGKGEVIGYFSHPSKEECMAAVKQNGKALLEISYYRDGEYVDPDIINQAIISSPDVFAHIPNERMTEEIIILALNQDINTIHYIIVEDYITENVMLEVVKKNGIFIRLFDNPSEKVKRVAVAQNKFAKLYIKS